MTVTISHVPTQTSIRQWWNQEQYGWPDFISKLINKLSHLAETEPGKVHSLTEDEL